MRTLSILTALLFIGTLTSSAQRRGSFPVRMDKVFYYDSIPNPISDSNSYWTFGVSQKSFLKPDTGNKQVWITDTVNLLSGKKQSHIDFAFPYPFQQADNYHISIKHKFDFDSLSGGSILISTDNGENYYPIWSDTGYYSPFWWHQGLYAKSNLLFNGEAGFTGKSSTWVQTELNFTYFILVKKPEPKPLMIRFLYQSADSAKPHEGWILEDLKLGREYRSGSVNEFGSSNPLSLYPNPASTILNLVLPEAGEINIYDLQGKIFWQKRLEEGEQKIELPILNNGVYYLTYVSEHYQISKKILLQKP